MLFEFSEELLVKWKIPAVFNNSSKGPDAILGYDPAAQFEILFAELRARIGSGRFEEAFHTLEQLKLLDTPHSRLLENDLAFLFLPDSSLEENELYWRTHKEIVAQRAAIWYALTGETQRAAENEIYDDAAQDFLRLRLEQFGANLEQWRNLAEKYKILVILDGFDEMSTGMDLQTVEKNAVRLCAAIRFFSGAKVIVTSRYPVFQSVKGKLISYFANPKVIRLLPIGFQEKMDCLTVFAEKNNCLERLQRLCATHDVMELASKPLFLDMLKSILLDEGIVVPDNISIYGSFSRTTMERKVLFEREEMKRCGKALPVW